MDGLVEAAGQVGREAVFASYRTPGHDGLRRALDHLLETRAEGIVFYPSVSLPIDDKLLVAELRQVPTVLVDIAVEGLDLPLVTSDDVDGIRQAVDHLVSLGHQRVAHLAGPSWMSTGAARLRAFTESVAQHGLQVPEEWIVRYDYTYGQALTAAQKLLRTAPLPTAAIAADDKGAAALLEVARHEGLRVPGDLSVIGYSDTLLCHTWDPPLTTVRQPKEDLGREAIGLLAALIEGNESVNRSSVHLLPTQLIVRGSCGRHTGRKVAPALVPHARADGDHSQQESVPMP